MKIEEEYDPSATGIFEDPGYSTNHFLTKVEAINRKELVSDVNYTLIMGLVKGGETFRGKVTIDFTLSKRTRRTEESKGLFIDYKGKTIHKITANGKQIMKNTPNIIIWEDHRIYIPI